VNELALFAGIGGIGLGLKRAFERRGLPFRTVCYVEWDDYCIEVLKSRIRDGMLDDAPIWGDIAAFDGRPWAGCVDIVTGGFPCQDLSFAGKGAGLEGGRSGLFFELMRVVREVRPGIVLLENVPALLIRGFDRVAAEMAASGYDLQWDCLPAAAVGAPHRRDRVFVVAHAKQDNCFMFKGALAGEEKALFARGKQLQSRAKTGMCDWWISEPPVDRVVNGLPAKLDKARVGALGNAVVPQVAEYVGERLIEWLDSDRRVRRRE